MQHELLPPVLRASVLKLQGKGKPMEAGSGPRDLAVDGLVLGAAGGLPDRTEIDRLDFQAFNLQPQRAATGKGQRHHAAGGVSLGKFDGEKIENLLLGRAIKAAALARKNAIEAERGT